MKLDNNLNYKWGNWIADFPYFTEEPYKMRRAHDGGFLIVGLTNRPGLGGWFVKTDTNGFALPNGADTLYHIGIEEKNICSTDQTLTVYPNPAVNRVVVTIGYNTILPNGFIKIYDLQGRLVKNEILVNKQKYIVINISDLNTGIYLIEYVSKMGLLRNKLLVE